MAATAVGAAHQVTTSLELGASPGLLFVFVALVSIAFLYLQHRRLRASATRGVALALLVLRGMLLGALLLLLLEPSVVRRRMEPLTVRLPVLVDVSRSMGLAWDGATSRLDAARGVAASLGREIGLGAAQPVLYAVDGSPRPIGAAELAAAGASGTASDLTGALQSLGGEAGDGPILVITDGRQTGADAVPAERRPGLVLVGMGNKRPLRDVRLADLSASDLAFQGKAAEVTAILRHEGFAGREVSVSLSVDGRLAAVRKVTLPPEGPLAVTMGWTPQELGSHRLEIVVKPPEADDVAGNDRRDAVVKVARDRLRVLFIAGAPSWNYRFLREALKRDPSLDLISFIILRGMNDVADVSSDELSLIPFPTKKLFTEELGNFDLVIFDNFGYRQFFPAEYLTRLKERVTDGGAFWMWGGSLTLNNGAYRGTSVDEMLPVSLEGAPPGEGYVQGPFHARLTSEALAGPLFGSLGEVAGDPPGSALPVLGGYNPTGPVRPGGVVLVEHPGASTGREPQPIVATRTVGRGRVMLVATDYLWNWDFQAAGSGLGNRGYLDFVKNSVRWLTGDPFLSPVRLTLSPASPAMGEPVTAVVRVFDDRFRPVSGASLEMTVTSPGGRRETPAVQAGGEAGRYEATFRPDEEGVHVVRVRAASRQGLLGTDTAEINAAGYRAELAAPSLDETFLKNWAAAAGGTYLRYEDSEAFRRELERALRPVGERMTLVSEERVGLGGLGIFFLVLVLGFSVDWFLRRRFRLE